jgi:competence protein ComEC
MSKSSYVSNSEIFYVRGLLPFATGIVFLRWCPWILVSAPFIYLLTGFVALSLILVNICYSKAKVYKYKILISIVFHLLMFMVGYSLTISKSDIFNTDYFAKKPFTYIKIVVNQEPQLKNTILMFKAKVILGYRSMEQCKTTGNVLVSVKNGHRLTRSINYGDVLIIPNNAQLTKANANPATFNYKKWLETQHIHHQIYLSVNQLIITNDNKGNSLVRHALSFRAQQVRYFRQILQNDNAYSVACTLILGYRADLDEELLSYYTKTGTIHALSVSGMHVGLIYVVLEWIFIFFNRRKLSKFIKLIVIFLLIWSYTLLTGLSPSVLRAAIMISVFMIGKGINRSANGVNILAFSAFLILLYDPLIIWDVGFQLSYLAVLGLILLQPIIENWFFFKNILFKKIWSAVSISLAAQLFTFPLSIYYFHQFPLYFLVSNLFIFLPVTVIMYLGIIILLFRLTFLAEILEWLIKFTNSGLRFIAEMPFSSLSSLWISNIELLLLSGLIAMLLIGLSYYKKKLVLYSLVLCLLMQISSAFKKYNMTTQRKLVLFNIRNYYAIGFITGSEGIIYSELKINDNLFRKNILPFLEQQHVTSVICTEDLSSVKRQYFRNNEDEIRFHDYLMSKNELQLFNMGSKKAIVKRID